ncbi:unnamed protein product [Acanthoscelides obtectus]|uniref:Uncharacterized protein n=1 Tax=Acanthoscelides obtectus TaxID=200917 RepID=A0A9P0QB05_ACAOB|nr:unnamed protein product [Acanthoscelides obtectus]CAK1649531.1 hypothetical protein AOBTE_LOCUS16298 [Acanthoscelides obtectus]
MYQYVQRDIFQGSQATSKYFRGFSVRISITAGAHGCSKGPFTFYANEAYLDTPTKLEYDQLFYWINPFPMQDWV